MTRLMMELSSLSFLMVFSSLLFAWIGYKVDIILETPPMFMTGLLILGLIMSSIRLYRKIRENI
jgi:F0F1-type ATP synthase assembly protein I